MTRIAAVVVLALVLVLLPRGGAVHGQGAALDPFYTPPSPLPPGRPGELIRAEPMASPAGLRAWRILYHSTTLDGRDVAVSGSLFLPAREPPRPMPVIAVAHGTTGVARACAPSIDPFAAGQATGEPPYLLAQAFVEEGYAAVMTDYQGLGAAGGVHPYLVGLSEGRNVLDSVRAARAVAGKLLGPEVVLWGHSQGGHAAAWAARLAPEYAPEERIAGLIAGAPVADLSLILNVTREVWPSFTTPSPLTGLLAMIGYAWSAVYPDTSAADVFTPAGLERAPVIGRECILPVLEAFGDRPPAAYLSIDGLTSPRWSDLARQNTVSGVRLTMPVLVVQGSADPVVPPLATRVWSQGLCQAGSTVDLRVYDGADHITVVGAAFPDMLRWTAERLRGLPAPSTCGA